MGVIYGLFDPRKPLWLWEVRYIGQTIKVPAERRLSGHIWEANRGDRDSYTLRWLRSLLRDDVRPHFQVLETCEDKVMSEREVVWIASGRRQGWRLTNASNGGESNAGFKHTAESREKMSLAKRGRPQTDEHKRNAAEATRLAKANDPTILEKVSESLKKFYAENPEERQDISERNRQWWIDHPEARIERSKKEIAYNQEHPEMIIRRNAAIQAAHLAKDKSPLDCPECGGGPFKGESGLVSHIRQAHDRSMREPLYCECGAGPFLGKKGLGHHSQIHQTVDMLMCDCGAGPFRGQKGLRVHKTRFCRL